MGNIYPPYSMTRRLDGCGCGAHASQAESLSDDFIEAALVKALFPHNATCRRFLRTVGVGIARIAGIMQNTMPRNRTHAGMHHDPQFYRIRNHLVDFLVHRSKKMQGEALPNDWMPQAVTPACRHRRTRRLSPLSTLDQSGGNRWTARQ